MSDYTQRLDQASKPRYGPYFKEDGSPAYLDLTQALAFDFIAHLSGGLLKLSLLIYTVTNQWGRDKGAPKPISYAEFRHYLNLNPRAIRAGLEEGIERCVISVVPGAGTRPSCYWVRPVADWLPLQHPKRKHFTIRSASTSPSEADHFTSGSAVIGPNHLDNAYKPTNTSRPIEEERVVTVADFDGEPSKQAPASHQLASIAEQSVAPRVRGASDPPAFVLADKVLLSDWLRRHPEASNRVTTC